MQEHISRFIRRTYRSGDFRTSVGSSIMQCTNTDTAGSRRGHTGSHAHARPPSLDGHTLVPFFSALDAHSARMQSPPPLQRSRPGIRHEGERRSIAVLRGNVHAAMGTALWTWCERGIAREEYGLSESFVRHVKARSAVCTPVPGSKFTSRDCHQRLR